MGRRAGLATGCHVAGTEWVAVRKLSSHATEFPLRNSKAFLNNSKSGDSDSCQSARQKSNEVSPQALEEINS